MKKIISLLCITLLSVVLIGCGSKSTKLDAEGYSTKLRDAGMEINNLIIYTAETDENELLGRPNQYTSKVNFDNGTIEVFEKTEDAKERKEYIDNIGKKMNALVEYSYIKDGTLLRINKDVAPDMAEKYKEAFEK
ncbi:LptM family lipoprotein [Clostridium gasigenes]|uniref:LptM family lipoprotein n=1 Tax=Clostridium gasigenes TaxID=94869 RepID=UPI001C0E5B11|nr:hypothetical protein [Clostridium gasigenes]MBU3103010.1 hypothetical protein [Clostridium gasigenes]